MKQSPIGIFDSGLGGLSVFQAMTQLLPHEQLVYFADSAFCPYGQKTEAVVISRSIYIAELLQQYSCKLILVACNTATAIAISELRKSFTVPFVGTEPAIKQAARQSKTGKVGVLATENTLKSKKYNETAGRFASHVQVWVQPGHGLVEIIEQQDQHNPHTLALIEQLLSPMLAAGIDQLVLGCTHYPFLRAQIEKVCGPSVNVIDPAPAIAQQVKRLLSPALMAGTSEKAPEHQFLCSGNMTDFLRKKDYLLNETTGKTHKHS